MNGPVFVDTPDVPVDTTKKRIASLIASAEHDIDSARRALDPTEALVDANLAQAKIALATFLRGGR